MTQFKKEDFINALQYASDYEIQALAASLHLDRENEIPDATRKRLKYLANIFQTPERWPKPLLASGLREKSEDERAQEQEKTTKKILDDLGPVFLKLFQSRVGDLLVGWVEDRSKTAICKILLTVTEPVMAATTLIPFLSALKIAHPPADGCGCLLSECGDQFELSGSIYKERCVKEGGLNAKQLSYNIVFTDANAFSYAKKSQLQILSSDGQKFYFASIDHSPRLRETYKETRREFSTVEEAQGHFSKEVANKLRKVGNKFRDGRPYVRCGDCENAGKDIHFIYK